MCLSCTFDKPPEAVHLVEISKYTHYHSNNSKTNIKILHVKSNLIALSRMLE